jgi:hypothetical protein
MTALPYYDDDASSVTKLLKHHHHHHHRQRELGSSSGGGGGAASYMVRLKEFFCRVYAGTVIWGLQLPLPVQLREAVRSSCQKRCAQGSRFQGLSYPELGCVNPDLGTLIPNLLE